MCKRCAEKGTGFALATESASAVLRKAQVGRSALLMLAVSGSSVLAPEGLTHSPSRSALYVSSSLQLEALFYHTGMKY